MGVMIHGAIRNVTVSVKMGVRGISWRWGVSESQFSLLLPKEGRTDESLTFIEHLLHTLR